MAADNPPRFVPTLTETANNITPSTAVEDTAYFEQRDPVDSMLDLDLSDLEAPVSRIEQVSPLGAYQGNRVVNPQAVNRDPVVPKLSPIVRPAAAPPDVPVRAAPVFASPAAAADPQKPASLQSMLPGDWSNQLRAVVQQAVRQELQQQMPFLLLQWSKQIEDKLTPHIHQQLVNMVQEWQRASSR